MIFEEVLRYNQISPVECFTIFYVIEGKQLYVNWKISAFDMPGNNFATISIKRK